MKRTVSVLAVLALLIAAVGAVPHADSAETHGPRSLLQRMRSGGAVPRRSGGHEVNTEIRGAVVAGGRRPFPIVLPSEAERTKLTLQREGLDVLRGIKGPIAPVVVIGPYRSGKSFLLNQMLGVSCGEGFGVGHTRKTETKGVWIWGEPMTVDGDEVNVVFVDTEGFEATGMSDAYDDRIFALSSIMSSVLVYNLPETVKEGDIEKLSFAVELAQEFYTRASANNDDGGRPDGQVKVSGYDDDEDEAVIDADVSSQLASFLPRSLVWLIQRDFLEGSTVNQMVRDALKSVPNPSKDTHVDELNRIRTSLRALAGNSTAFGLRQPHLERTKLCELRDDELEPAYVEQRDQLRRIITQSAKAKAHVEIPGSAPSKTALGSATGLMTGPALAALIERSVSALNEGDFPSAGNVVDSFNRDALERHVASYVVAMDGVRLPVDEDALTSTHRQAAAKAVEGFRRDRFGRGAVTTAALRRKLAEMLEQRKEKNAFVSGKECETLATTCEEELVGLQTMRLPSLRKFDTSSKACQDRWSTRCVGPSRETYGSRIKRSTDRERSAFLQNYNARLLNGLLMLSIGGIVTFRFLYTNALGELVAWCLFIALEVGPKLYLGGDGMFESAWWTTAVQFWEVAVYNQLIDMDKVGPVLLCAALAGVVYVRVRRCVQWLNGCCPCIVRNCCCTSLLGIPNARKGVKGKRKTAVSGRTRDLDV